MRYIFKFPDIGEGIQEGKILKWYVEKGQAIQSGDPVVQMETDKVVADIPSPKAGVVVARFGKVGEVIHVDDALVEIEIEGVSGGEAQKIAKEKPAPATVEPAGDQCFGVVGTLEVAGDAAYLPASPEGAVETAERKEARPRKAQATPVARSLAKELGVDIGQVPGTGPGGRVTKEDIHLFHDQIRIGQDKPSTPLAITSPPPRVEYEPLSQIRKTIARNMTISKQTAVHMTLTEEADISHLWELREKYKTEFEAAGQKLTLLPFILKTVTEALKKHKSLNSEIDLEQSRMIYKQYYNLGIAVDTEEGLVVPVVRDVDRMSIRELAAAVAGIATRARERKLTLDDFKDGTFTVTNYGAIGGLFGVPVINYPQVAILGVGRANKKPVVRSERVEVAMILPLSISVDHRVVDGGEATRFINDIVKMMEDPYRILLV